VPEHDQLSGSAGEPHRHCAAHAGSASREPHQPADERDVLSLGGPGSRPAGPGRRGGVAEATMTALPRLALAVWAVLVVLSGLVAIIEYTDRPGPQPARGSAEDARWLLPLPLAELGAIEIADAGTLHRFEKSPTGVWFYHGAHSGAESGHVHPVDPALAQR